VIDDVCHRSRYRFNHEGYEIHEGVLFEAADRIGLIDDFAPFVFFVVKKLPSPTSTSYLYSPVAPCPPPLVRAIRNA
jgi:hypothetical protein